MGFVAGSVESTLGSSSVIAWAQKSPTGNKIHNTKISK